MPGDHCYANKGAKRSHCDLKQHRSRHKFKRSNSKHIQSLLHHQSWCKNMCMPGVYTNPYFPGVKSQQRSAELRQTPFCLISHSKHQKRIRVHTSKQKWGKTSNLHVFDDLECKHHFKVRHNVPVILSSYYRWQKLDKF